MSTLPTPTPAPSPLSTAAYHLTHASDHVGDLVRVGRDHAEGIITERRVFDAAMNIVFLVILLGLAAAGVAALAAALTHL